MDFKYKKIGDSITIEEYIGKNNVVEIPSEIESLPVKKIGDFAFAYCGDLVKIKIPDSITEIDEYAFCECKSLIEIKIPKGLKYIGECAFWGCSALETINIPLSVEEISGGAFTACVSLKNFNVPDKFFKDNLFIYEKMYTNEIKIHSFFGKDSIVEIPENIYDLPIITIGDNAFHACENLKEIKISEGIKFICKGAFHYCTGLTKIIIPNSVNEIEESAFYDCFNLTEAVIPYIGRHIGARAFTSCGFKRIYTQYPNEVNYDDLQRIFFDGFYEIEFLPLK